MISTFITLKNPPLSEYLLDTHYMDLRIFDSKLVRYVRTLYRWYRGLKREDDYAYV
jgi:hypothetical protein